MPESDDVLPWLILSVLDETHRPLTPEEIMVELERRFAAMAGPERERGH